MIIRLFSISLVILTITSSRLLSDSKKSTINLLESSCDKERFENDQLQTGKYTFKSLSNDVEKNGIIQQSNKEVSYHIFDYINKKVTFISKSQKSAKWVRQEYKFHRHYIESEYLVLVCEGQAVKEIWASTNGTNLGYDFYNGIRMAFYDLEVVEE